MKFTKMNDINNFIESGILEMYVLGKVNSIEIIEVEKMLAKHPAIANEILAISKALESYAKYYSLAPDVILKPTILSTIDFMDRLKNGEPLSFPPLITKLSKISDYAEWINREDMVLPVDFIDFYIKVISHTDIATLAISWLKDCTPVETHTNQLESFLIIEGTCTVTIEDEEHKLQQGDILQIPLYKKHFVKVTSPFACKIILQRIAA